jgi:ATP-binding cassette subfamily F protein uup
MEGEGKVRDFPGNYTDYREWRDSQGKNKSGAPGNGSERPSGTILQNQIPAPVVSQPTTNGSANGSKKKLSFKEIKEYETLEKEIESLEQRKSEVVGLLNTGGHHEQLTGWAREIEQIEQSIAQKSDRWLELAEYI